MELQVVAVCLDKGLSVKEHISFIGKTAFCLELRAISTIGDFLTVDATCWLLGTSPCWLLQFSFVVYLVLSRTDHCSALLVGLPQSLISI